MAPVPTRTAKTRKRVTAVTLMPEPSLAPDWVPFSSRYGLVNSPLGRDHWTARHADHGAVRFGCCPPDPQKVCACLGSNRQCCEVASAEDLLCDACREHCWAVDPESNQQHRLVDAYAQSSSLGAS